MNDIFRNCEYCEDGMELPLIGWSCKCHLPWFHEDRKEQAWKVLFEAEEIERCLILSRKGLLVKEPVKIPEHVCGLVGFGQGREPDYCEACEKTGRNK